MQQALQGDTGILYHVTTAKDVMNIWDVGVDPQYSRGKLEASWYINKHNILWAIAHVSARHQVSVDQLYVCAVLIEWKSMRRTARPGFYYTLRTFRVENLSPAEWYLNQEEK
jgi:hypothetical protein